MDIARLTTANTTGAATAAASSNAAALPAGAAPLGRPADAGDGSDRIERSEELAHALLVQKEGLARLAPPTQERIDEYRAGLAGADSLSRASLESAASGLLRGELFFAPAAPIE